MAVAERRRPRPGLLGLASFTVAQKRITTKFSGLVGAYATEQEATFLATHQVDTTRASWRARPPGTDHLAGLDWSCGEDGVPLVADALAVPECEIVAEHPAADHTIAVGQVDRMRVTAAADPLVFFAGAFRSVR